MVQSNVSCQDIQAKKYYRLSDITSQIKASLLDLSRSNLWVRANLLTPRGGIKGGHFYCELIDVDEHGNQLAKMRATIWSSSYLSILRKLETAGFPEALKDNTEVCVLCAVRYHNVYGLSLNIIDIDPTFGESQIDRNRRLIIEKLSSEGILKENAKTRVAVASLNIGLIASKDTASYCDFTKTLFTSDYSFRIVLADCTMQGTRTESDVIEAIMALAKAKIDIICIVRGGGSQTDLAWFDNENIARTIIKCPVPVWVGIGHEIDKGVIDVVAHSSFKTPTAVAEALFARVQDLFVGLNVDRERLVSCTERILATAKQEFDRSLEGAINGYRKLYDLTRERLEKKMIYTGSVFSEDLSRKENGITLSSINLQKEVYMLFKQNDAALSHKLQLLTNSFNRCRKDHVNWIINKGDLLSSTCGRLLKSKGNILSMQVSQYKLQRYLRAVSEKENSLNQHNQRLASLRPENVLKRGYSLTRDLQGKIITSIQRVGIGDEIQTILSDGHAQSVVRSKGEEGDKL